MGNIQKHWDAISVAGCTGLWEHLQQALPARWGQGGELQYLQRMPGDLIAVPTRSWNIRQASEHRAPVPKTDEKEVGLRATGC